MSPVKEPHYFSTDLANRSVTSYRRYRRLFKRVTNEHRAVGEASTWYLYSNEAVPNIEQTYPYARYIVMTRDPVAMVHSLYHHNLRVLHEDQPTLEQAWRLQDERSRGWSMPLSCTEPAFLQYRDACALGTLVKRVLNTVPTERVLHVPLEAMKSDTREEYLRVLSFLGLEDDGREEFPIANEARTYQSRILQRMLKVGGRLRIGLGFQKGLGLAQINDRRATKAPLDDAFREELEVIFREERKLLDELTKRSHPVCQPEAIQPLHGLM